MFADKSKFGGHSLNGFEVYLTFFFNKRGGIKSSRLKRVSV